MSTFIPKEASEIPWKIDEAAIGFIVWAPYRDSFGADDETPIYCLTRERAEKIANIPVLAYKVAKEGLSDFSTICELMQIVDNPRECEHGDWREDFSPLLQLKPSTWPKVYPSVPI